MRLKSVVAALLTIVCALLGGAAQADWLSSQAQSDGSYSTTHDIATPTQATSEAVRALRFLGRGAPNWRRAMRILPVRTITARNISRAK